MAAPSSPTVGQKQALFLQAFRDTGTIRKASALAEVGRSTVQRWRTDNVDGFRARFDEALDDFADGLEAKMFEMLAEMKVGHNPTMLIFALKALRPLKYRELTQIPDENSRDLLRKLEQWQQSPGPGQLDHGQLGPESESALQQVERLLREKR